MAKRFRLRLSRVFPSFQSRRSKDDAGFTVTNPAFRLSPINRKAFDIDFPPPPPPPLSSSSFPHRPHPPVVSSPACSCLPSRRGCIFSPADIRETPAYLWRKEGKWHVVAYADGDGGGRYDFPSSPRRKIDSDDCCDILLPAAMAKAMRRDAKLRRRRRLGKTKRSSRSRARVSTSSANSGWFSSEGDEENDEWVSDYFDEEEDGETETLVSSTDCSSDNVLRRRRIRRRRRREVVKCYPSPERTAAAVLRRLVPCGAAATAVAEGKVRESFAVVKRSEDPRADFRRSMAEMMVEKEMYDASDLEQLLRCFLSLNSRRYHGAIAAAFSDIWQSLFSAAATATPAAAPGVPKN